MRARMPIPIIPSEGGSYSTRNGVTLLLKRIAEEDKWLPSLVLLLYTLISLFFFTGYHVFAFDQQRYIPPIYQMFDGELYRNEYRENVNTHSSQAAYTIFDEFIFFISGTFNIDIFTVLFILTVIVRFSLFYALYRMSFYFTDNKCFSLLFPLLFISNHGAFGTAISTLDPELHPRAISLVLNLVSLLLYLNNKKFFSSLFIGVALWMHPIMTVPFLLIYYVHLFFFTSPHRRFNLTKENVLLGLIPLLFLIAFLLIFVPPGSFGLFDRIDPEWREIILPRMPYAFLFTVISLATIDLVFDAIISAFYWIVSKRKLAERLTSEKKTMFNLLLFVPLVLFVVSILLADVLKLHFFAALQIGRSLFLWKILLPLSFSYYAFKDIKKNPQLFFNNFLMIGILSSFIISEKMVLIFLPVFFISWLSRELTWRSEVNVDRPKHPFKRLICSFIKKAGAKHATFSFLLILVVVFVASTIILGNYKDISKYHFIRSLLLITLFSFITSLFFFHRSQNSRRRWYACFLITILLISCAIYFYTPLSIKPAILQNNSFNEACTWIKENTNKDEVILTEPFSSLSSEIRLLCLRNIYFSYSTDGSVVIFSKDLAIEWHRRYRLIETLRDEPALKEVLKSERVNYIFSERPLISLEKNQVFSNKDYFVYRA